MNWLNNTGRRKTSACGRDIEIWALTPQNNKAVLSAWATHFRQHYIEDAMLPQMISGTGKTKTEYLEDIIFPDSCKAPGPSLRSGDFGEILVADYIEFFLGYWCARELCYQDRGNNNDPTKGCDIIGFKFVHANGAADSNDELFIVESKVGASVTKANRLQDAIVDSGKDRLREGISLNAIKHRFLKRDLTNEANRVERFQDEADRPFRRINGAAAVLDDKVFAATNLTETDATGHFNIDDLKLIVIRAPSLMNLVHALYKRAADEA